MTVKSWCIAVIREAMTLLSTLQILSSLFRQWKKRQHYLTGWLILFKSLVRGECRSYMCMIFYNFAFFQNKEGVSARSGTSLFSFTKFAHWLLPSLRSYNESSWRVSFSTTTSSKTPCWCSFSGTVCDFKKSHELLSNKLPLLTPKLCFLCCRCLNVHLPSLSSACYKNGLFYHFRISLKLYLFQWPPGVWLASLLVHPAIRGSVPFSLMFSLVLAVVNLRIANCSAFLHQISIVNSHLKVRHENFCLHSKQLFKSSQILPMLNSLLAWFSLLIFVQTLL